jgi:hypothetical protein
MEDRREDPQQYAQPTVYEATCRNGLESVTARSWLSTTTPDTWSKVLSDLVRTLHESQRECFRLQQIMSHAICTLMLPIRSLSKDHAPSQ